MKRVVLFLGFVLVLLANLVLSLTVQAQQEGLTLDKFILGKWTWKTPSPGGGNNISEIEFKPDGSIFGKLDSVRVGLVLRRGTYRVDDNRRVVVDGIFDGGPNNVSGTKFTLTLQREGENVTGEGISQVTNRKFEIVMTRVPAKK